MRSHGVPDFYFSKSNSSSTVTIYGGAIPASIQVDSPQFEAGMRACRHVLGVPGGTQTEMAAARLRGLVKAAGCMRADGYPNYPDPSVESGGVFVPPVPSSIDTNSPQFLAAAKKCGAASSGGTEIPGGG